MIFLILLSTFPGVLSLSFAGLGNVENPGYFQLNTVLREQGHSSISNLFKRDEHVILPLAINRNIYTTTLSVGSNQQLSEVMLDSGSSDTWVKGLEGLACDKYIQGTVDHDRCLKFGYFDSQLSKTFQSKIIPFNISYKDNTYAYGSWARDGIKLSGSNTFIPDYLFGLVNETNNDYGVMGIGLPRDDQKSNENILNKLKKSGLINRKMYAISIRPSGASVIFGGLDKNMFLGELHLFPILKLFEQYINNKKPTRLDINLRSVSIFKENSNNDNKTEEPGLQITDQTMYCLLDTGSTFSYFPEAAVEKLVDELNLRGTNDGNFEIDCHESDKYWIEFDFQGWKKKLKLDNFKERFRDKCYLGIGSSNSDTATLGDNFLRQVYLTVDFDSFQVGLADINPTYSESEANIQITQENSEYGVPIPEYYNSSYLSSVESGNVSNRILVWSLFHSDRFKTYTSSSEPKADTSLSLMLLLILILVAVL